MNDSEKVGPFFELVRIRLPTSTLHLEPRLFTMNARCHIHESEFWSFDFLSTTRAVLKSHPIGFIAAPRNHRLVIEIGR